MPFNEDRINQQRVKLETVDNHDYSHPYPVA